MNSNAPASPDLEFAASLNILGVDYTHARTAGGGDLYLTPFGVHFHPHLLPENWLEKTWFEAHRVRLEGSSTVYRTCTRPVAGRSLDIVVKWCRVGEEVPFDTMTLNKFAQADFNSPYEEFALLMEMRKADSPGVIRTHRPLAIYVPGEILHAWQTGRSESKLARKKARHRDVELDIFRQYILIYEWIKGASVVEALEQTDIPPAERGGVVSELTQRAITDLAYKGFRVLDMKPAHVIVRTDRNRRLLHDRSGHIAYALVDFELLERTPEHADEVIQARRREYLRKQRDRFAHIAHGPLPPHLRSSELFGVRYVFGHVESTRGWLWTVGNDPGLFDYFLPERWRRTHKIPLSKANDAYWTRTKDYINVVWKVGRVGERPEVDPDSAHGRRLIEAGFNSPFEEFALAVELSARGINTVYPRAIYMTGLESEAPDYVEDESRFRSHAALRSPAGFPVLMASHNYITIWGFWNGRDEMLATPHPVYCQGINLDLAREGGHISHAEHERLLEIHRKRLLRAGVEDLNLKGGHVLLSLTTEGILIRGPDGLPEMRHCNFEFMRRVGSPTPPCGP